MSQNIYTVAQVNAYIRNMFTQDFMLQSLMIRGEISNCKYHSSGHIYFTLKDEKGTLSCVMFAGSRNGLTFTLKEGMQVVVSGTVDVYERDGKYQLYARQIKQDGSGLLYEKFEALKKELEERGMFDARYKRPVPKYIRTLGVVTAPTGAAVRDIITVAKRRNPYIRILLYPAIVQGDMAAQSIANGIRALERQGVDVMIVGRGGGSLEDLWAFNEELVAEAIFDCSIPIISAVGHETDYTIADFTADLRAATPSAAAELAVFDHEQFEADLNGFKETLLRLMKGKIQSERKEAEIIKQKLMRFSPMGRIRDQKMRLIRLEEGLQKGMKMTLTDRRHRLALYLEQFRALSPLDKLNKGYAYVEDASGKALKQVEQTAPGELVQIHVTDGMIKARVEELVRAVGKEEDTDVFGREIR